MSECPHPAKLLQLIADGEYVPHLRECAKCAEFVATATATVKAFTDREELEKALSDLLDDVISKTYGHRMSSAVRLETKLHRSIVVRELLRRAGECLGSNVARYLDLTNAAVVVCDAMTAAGHAPEPELHIEALKEHSKALRQVGELDDAIAAIDRAAALAAETNNAEYHRAVLSLCAAIVNAEPDRAKFDEAIALADAAWAVLELCGDARRAVLARQTKAYVHVVKNEFAKALPLLFDVIAELEHAANEWAVTRDVAIAYTSLAHCLVGTGSYAEAATDALLAERLHLEVGGTSDAARAAHIRARAVAAQGKFEEARTEFERTAEIVFEAQLFDEWAIMRLDYIAAAIAHDASANVRADCEAVARVCMAVNAKDSNQRRQYAAEALAYLRQLAVRDTVTVEAVDHIRAFVVRNSTRPPVKFSPPPGGLVM